MRSQEGLTRKLLHRLVAVVEDTNFIHSEALLVQHLQVLWNKFSGATKLEGLQTWTETNSFYDGGFTSAGIFGYNVIWCLGTDLGTVPSPNALWTWTLQSCVFADHG